MCELVTEEEIDNVFSLRYFNLMKKLQLSVGLWPFYSIWWKYFIKILLYSILFVAMIPLCNGFRIWCGVDLDICGENTLGVIYTVAVFFKYFFMSLSEKKLKRVYERLARNWLVITKPDERAIMLEHAKVGRIYSIIIFAIMIFAGICFSQIPVVPAVLDVILPLNESRPKILFVRAEYIIDPYEHFSKLYLYFLVAGVLTVLSFASIDTTYCTVVYQILGIMSVIKHRLTTATQYADGEIDNSYDSIVSAIKLHQESILLSIKVFVKLIEASYSIVFLFIIVGTTIFISIGVTMALYSECLVDLIRFIPMLTGAFLHIFYLSLTAQKIIDYSNDLFTTIYMTEWYKISARSKKLLRFMMLRTTKPCVLTGAGFYIMNLQNFGKIIKTTVSYTTVFSSFR